MMDCYDDVGCIPPRLRSTEFLETCYQVLSLGGAFIVNMYDGFEEGCNDSLLTEENHGDFGLPFVDKVTLAASADDA